MSWWNPTSWDNPFDDIVELGEDAIDAAADVARDAVSVAELLGDGIVDAAVMVGEGVVTAGEAAARWSINAAGDVVDWTQTSFAEVAEWTESAAGDLASFTLEAYRTARAELENGVKFLYEQLANFFSERLPELGAIDPKAREVAAHLLSEPVARGLADMAGAVDCTLMFGVELRAGSSAGVGLYVCGEGWGFYVDSHFEDLQAMLADPELGAGVSAQVTMVFRAREDASGARAIKLGVGMKSSPMKSLGVAIGGVVLMEATMPPLFLGLRYQMDLDLSLFGQQTPDGAPRPRWKVHTALPTPNGEFLGEAAEVAEVGWDELTGGLSGQAANWDAAARAHADPGSESRVTATALAASLAAFKPRYFGALRTRAGQPLVGTSQGALGVGVAGDRATFCLVAGLTDATGVSIEAVGEPSLYVRVTDGGDVRLVPYERSDAMRSATFKLERGADGGVLFGLAHDPPGSRRALVVPQGSGDLHAAQAADHGASFVDDATFLLDRPEPQPEALGPLLRPGQFLQVGQSRRSPNGMYLLKLGAGGRLAVCRRNSSDLDGADAWFVYEPGLLQDLPPELWHWASPQPPASPAGYHAIVTDDGRLAVRTGAAPGPDAVTLWQTEVRGEPGPCFLAVSNQGVVSLLRGTPERPGEIVWTSPAGALYWPTRRRKVALRIPGGGFVRALRGGGAARAGAETPLPPEPVRLGGPVVGGWELFELQDLCTGHSALRAQGRRFVSVQPDGAEPVVATDHVDAHALLHVELVGDPAARPQHVRIRVDHTGLYLGVTDGVLGARHALADATVFQLTEVEHDLAAHSGRPVHLIARHSGKVLEAPGGIDQEGRSLSQREHLGAEHQKWTLTYHGDGSFGLTNRQTGKAIDILGASTADLAPAVQWSRRNDANQRFSLIPTGDGHYFVVARHSGKALDVAGSSQADGGAVIQYTGYGTANQQWRIELAPQGRSSPWTGLGGGLTGRPAIASWGPGRVDIFARGLDDAVYQVFQSDAWSSWIGHGGGFFDGPAVTARDGGRVDVFARGKDDQIYQRWWDGGQWHGWIPHGGAAAAGPVALAPRPGRWDIFILGQDAAIWHRRADGDWSAWVSLGGGLLDPPTVLYRDGRYHLFARGLDNAVYHRSVGQFPLGEWECLGGGITGRPAVVAAALGHEVFARAPDGCVWTRSHRPFDPGTWSSLGGAIASDPAAISIAPGRVDLFAQGVDGALWHRRRVDEAWAPWTRLGLQIAGPPAVTSSTPGRIDIAVVAADGTLWHHAMIG